MEKMSIDWDALHATISTERHASFGQGKDVFMAWLVQCWTMLDGLRQEIVEKTGADEELLEALELHLFNEKVAHWVDPRTGERIWLPLWPDGSNRFAFLQYALAPRARLRILQELEDMDAQEIEQRATDLTITQMGQD